MQVQGATPEETDKVLAMKVKVVNADDNGNYNPVRVPLVNPELCAMVDNMWFLSS
jgi:hypothetical protein